MFFSDHEPPHFHAQYQNYTATFSIKTGKILDGKFPKKQEAVVTAWAILRKKELLENWEAAIDGYAIKKLEPLK
jgi:hypothetical protein